MAGLTTIQDRLGRKIDYARISLTDKCNYRCVYCMPEEGVELIPHERVMRYEEIIFLGKTLQELGMAKIRFTGGEPLVRRGALSFFRDFRRELPDMALSITTNGALLPIYADEIAEVGFCSMNLSLDTLDPHKFHQITRMGDLDRVIEGVAAARKAGIGNIKTNTVLIRGFNDDEIPQILSYAWNNGLLPRLIEFMPLGDDVWERDKFISAEEIMQFLSKYGDWHLCDSKQSCNPAADASCVPLGPAKYYEDSMGRKVGIIEAVSNHFCLMCNRLRITAGGNMRACLFSNEETPLAGFLKNRDAAGLKEAILEGIDAKPDSWRRSRDGAAKMSSIGG